MGKIGQLAQKIRQQVDASLSDPQTRILTASVVSGNYDWVVDPRTKMSVPAVKYHDRFYRVAQGDEAPPVCRPRDYQCEIVRVWNFNVLNVRYIADMDDADTYQDLRTTLETGSGDCDDMTTAFCAMLRSIGYQCAARIISVRGNSWDHIYPLVNIPSTGWVALDATESGKLPGWQYQDPAAVQDFEMGAGQ